MNQSSTIFPNPVSSKQIISSRGGTQAPWFSDLFLLTLVVLLVTFSLVMIYSTTGTVSQEKFGDTLFYVKRQGVAALIGMFLLIVLARIKIDLIRRISPYLIWICVGALLLTFIPGLGDRSGGAQRWLNLGIIRLQPAEFVKVMFIIFMASYFSRHEEHLKSFKYGILIPMCYVGGVASLLLLQPDFGSSSIVALVTLAMALLSGARLLHVFYSGLALTACAVPLIILSPYRLARVMAFLNPFEDPSGKGYQLVQSLIAIGSGQFSGLGLGASQQKLFFLPAAHTDFIFSVISEELGFIGAFILIFAFLIFLWRGLSAAKKVADDTFSYSLAVGLTLLIVAPALLNVGVVTGLLPTKGLVLPLIGFGGTSLIASLIAVALLLAIGRSVYTNK
jgi:cell division protein FtsW